MENFNRLVKQAADACVISPGDIEDVHGVTPMQEGLWTANTRNHDAYIYELVIEGKGNAAVGFVAAWQQLVRITPMLRSCMVVLAPANRMVQVVLRADSTFANQSCLFGGENANHLGTKGMAQLSFSKLASFGKETFRATLRIHHALFDGWAMRCVLDRLREAYKGQDLTSPPRFQQFIQYIHDQNTASDDNGTSQFWRAKLADYRPTNVVDRLPSHDALTDSTVKLTSQSAIRSRVTKVTLPAVVHAAWAMLAGSYAATDDVFFATTLSGRDVPVKGILDMAGPTMATVPCRVDVKNEQSVAKLLEQVTYDLHAAAAYQHVGLARICQEYGGFQSSQLQSLLLCQPSHLDVVGLQSSADSDGPDWTVVEHVDYVHPFALVIECWLPRGADPLRLTAHHDSKVLSSSQTRMLLEQLSEIIFKLHACVDVSSKSHVRVGDICLASSADLQALRRLNADCPAPVDRCVHELFTDVAKGSADSIAIDAWDEQITYRSLDKLSDALSQTLISLGVGHEMIVLVFFPKSAWAVVALLAVLKAGAAFVALEPAHPDGRIKDMARISGSHIAIAHSSLTARLESIIGTQYQVLELSHEAQSAAEFQVPPTPTRAVASPSSLAYIMFTSGTTGVPKGVAIEHRAVCSSITARAGPDVMNMTSSSRVLQNASYCFDPFIDEVFMTLTRGACLCIARTEELQGDLTMVINRYQITWLYLTPSVARMIDPKRTESLQTLTLGGEAAVLADIEQWRGHVSQLPNGYGPTECCIICVVADYFSDKRQSASSCLLGSPRGCLVWIVDPSNASRLMPLGAAGELLIEGPILARGYWENSAATEIAFISDPNWPLELGRGRRVYRTGDLVRMQPDGSLLYMGRISQDSQTKLRAQRFELAEVEQNVRNALPSVQQVMAVVFTPAGWKEKEAIAGENTRLAVLLSGPSGYASPFKADEGLDIEDVPWDEVLPDQLREELLAARRSLETSLPSYMIPSYWVPLQKMPLTTSTKADRKQMVRCLERLPHEKLAFFSLDQMSTVLKPATNHVEDQLVKLWSTVLGIVADKISVDSDFMSLGGDSIKAMRLAAFCWSLGFSGVSTTTILHLRTIETLAKEIQLAGTKRPENGLGDVPPAPFSLLSFVPGSISNAVRDAAKACQVAPSAIQDLYPAVPFQRELFALGLNSNDAYRGLFVYELRHEVDLERLQDAWCALAHDTPIIRTVMINTPSGISQAVLQIAANCEVVTSSLENHLTTQREASRAMSFGLPLYLASIVQDVSQGQGRIYFVLNAHHAVYDGWSVSGLIRRLKQLYHGQKHEHSYNSRNHYVRFVDHVLHVDANHQKSFWAGYLAENPFTAFPEVKPSSSQWEPFTNSSTEHAFSFRHSRIRPSIALYSAWAQLAAIYGGTDDVVFGIVSTGRDIATLPHSFDIMGPMAATLPLRVRIPTGHNTPVSAMFDTVQQAVSAATPYEHYGMNEIRKASPAAQAACGFHSLLVVQANSEAMEQREGADDLIVSDRDAGANIHPYPLVLEATPHQGLHDISVVAHYDSNLLDEATVKRLLEQLGHIVQEMVRLDDIGGTLGQIEFLSPNDKASIWGWNSDPAAIVSTQRCVHHVIGERTILNPDTTAVCAWDKSLTYADLDRLSSALSEELSRLGVKAGQYVPICHERSAWYVVSQVAVLKTGAACVSLDPSYPKARNDEIMSQCEASVVIVSRTTKPLLCGSSLAIVVAEFHPQLPCTPPASPDNSRTAMSTPSDPVYCVFTSGSTGKPKGIIIDHAALCTSALKYGSAMYLGPSSRVLHFASCAFDVSVGETLTTLMHGGCVCVPHEDERLADLAGCINRLEVNWLYLTSSVASLLRPDDVPGLETLVVGGEVVHQSVVEMWAERGVTLINAYGPAETTIYCSARTVPTRDTNARDIGTALGCRMWIGWAPEQDDGILRLAPLGATGELLIEGPILARGYLGRPDLNATQFVAVPWLSPDSRVYRTGDLARLDAQGHFHFRGRRGDGKVKVNGQRVDLGEIETSTATTRDDIHQVAVVTFERQAAAGLESHPMVRLAAFVVFADMASPLGLGDTDSRISMTDDLRARMFDIRKQLQRLLPKYMIPPVFLPMSSLPKTTTLKTDRKALTKRMEDMTETDFQTLGFSSQSNRIGNSRFKAPRSAMESMLLQHWTKSLGLSENTTHAGVEDNFFDLGGDSISAMRFVWLARGDGLRLSVADVHTNPTVSQLAELLSVRKPETSSNHEEDQIPLPFSLVSVDERGAVVKEIRELGIDADDVEDIYHATTTQVGLLLETEKQKGLWVAKDVLEFSADLDVDKLQVAWEALVERNAIFRTRIVYAASVGSITQAYQVVLRHGEASAVWDSGSGECLFGFGQPLSVLRLRKDRFEWIRHHALYDGWSTNLLLHQLEHLYRTGRPTTQIVLPPSCYIRMLQCHDAGATRSFWQAELGSIGDGALHACAFPRTLSRSPSEDQLSSFIARPSAASSAITRQVFSLPQLQSLPGTTISRLPTLIEAAWTLTLCAYVGSEDVMFGVVRSGRTRDPSLAHVVCPTASIVPRRYHAHDGKQVGVFLEETSKTIEDATLHEHAGLTSMQELLRHHQKVPTLNNLVVVQTEELVSGTSEAGGKSYLEAIGLKPATSSEGGDESPDTASPFPFGLVLECILVKSQASRDPQLQLLAYYDNHQACEDKIQCILSHFECILIQLIEARPGTLLEDIGIWNNQIFCSQMPFAHAAAPPRAVETCVQELIAEHWKQGSPRAHAPAVHMVQGNLILTYRDLETLSARLCHCILRDGRFKKQQSPFVPVCFHKSPWTVIAMLAVWRAGGAVILLDATQPQNISLNIVKRAKAGLVLVTPETRDKLPDHPSVMVVDSSNLNTPVAVEDAMETSTCLSSAANPCYCIFTSGSTGEPKGVVIQHRAIATSAVHHGRVTGLSATSRVLQFSSYSFDVAIDEIVSTLIYGGCVCVPSEGDTKARLAEAIDELDVNVVLLTPGVLETLDPAAVPGLKTVVVGGSSLSSSLCERWQDRVRLLVAYGPSECSVTAVIDTNMSRRSPNSIGKPVGCRAWVLELMLNDDGGVSRRPRLAPFGSVGELAIEGSILAQGYLGDEGLTSKNFILASDIAGAFCTFTGCSPHARLYRTGDIVTQGSDGSLVFIGRRDNQVKVRGMRVELESVEHAIIHSPDMAAALSDVVVSFPRKGPLQGRLVGVLRLREGIDTPDPGPAGGKFKVVGEIPQVKVIKASLSKQLPASHVPDVWVTMTSMPKLPSCKVDRASIRGQLEDTPYDRSLACTRNGDQETHESMTSSDKLLRDLMGQILLKDLSSDPSSATFPQLGGNSLMAMKLVARCKAAGAPVSLSSVLGNHTIGELAQEITASRMKTQPQPSKGLQVWGRVPLTPAQHMFFSSYPCGPNYFNQSVFLRVKSPGVSTEELHGYLLTIVRKHPALRSRFLRRQDKPDWAWRWECAITDDVSGSLRFRSHVIQEGQEAESIRCITSETQQGLNISAGPLCSAAAFIMPDGTLDVLLVAHHLVVDIVSWVILLGDLEVLLSGSLLPGDTAYVPSVACHQAPKESKPDDPAIMQETYEFWGINNKTVMAGKEPAPGPTKWTVSLTCSQTRALSAAVHCIERLDVADVVEAALGSAFAEMCRDSGRNSSPGMVVEEHGRDNEQSTIVGWFTRFRVASLSKSSATLIDSLWQARHRRMNSQGGKHSTITTLLPMELVLNFIGQPLISETESRLLEYVPSTYPHTQAVEEVPDTDPGLEPLALIEVVASLQGQSLSLTVACSGQLQKVDRVRACIDSSLRKLHVDAPAVLARSKIRQSLRPLPALDTNDYQISQQRRSQVAQILALDNIDDAQEVLPCTPTQARILLGQARNPRHYHVQVAWEVSTADGRDRLVDSHKLQEACYKVVQHHASLRTEFIHLPDLAAPVQIVLGSPCASKVLRVRSVSNGEDEAVQLELNISHAAFDGASTITVLRDIGRAYYDKRLDMTNTNTFQKYVAHVEQSSTEAAEAFWAQHLADAQPCCLPPMAIVRNSDDSEFRSIDCILDKKLQAGLDMWCSRFKATPAAAIHVAWALTLRAYTGLEDVIFGWMATVRDAPIQGIEDAIGMFSSLLVCRTTMGAGDRLDDVVINMVRELASGLEHRLGSPKIYQQGQALFDTLVSVQTVAPSLAKGEGLNFHQRDGLDHTEFALFLNAGTTHELVEFRLTYNSFKVPCSAARALFCAFSQAMGSLLGMTDPEMSVASIELCSPLHCQLAQDFNAQALLAVDGDLGTQIAHTILALFSKQVDTRPDGVAVESWDAHYTFAELDRLSAGLSRHLSRIGITRGQIVPLLCDKSAAVVVSLLAILRAGAACAFLSPSDGAHRLRNIIVGQVGARVVLASPHYAEKARALGCNTVLEVDSSLMLEHDLDPNDRTQCSVDESRPEDVAFVVFTSGSTGSPKGVMLAHSSFCFSVLNYGARLGISMQSRIFQFSAYTFDVGIGDMVAALIHGATLCVPSEHDRTSDLNGVIERSKSTWLMTTPSVAALLDPQKCSSLRSLAFIGEAPTPELYSIWHGRVRLFNTWGPAECAVLSSVHEVQSQNDMPTLIGEPVSCRLWLVHPSDSSRLVPSGSVGEILVEGPNVAYGYLNDEVRTNQSFISANEAPTILQPLLPSSRLYLTGDLARCLPQTEGLLFFEGRKDSQVKLRGQRIELGEIESHLCRRVQDALRNLGLSSHRVSGAVDIFKQRTGEGALAAFWNVCPASKIGAGADNPAVICDVSSLLGVPVNEASLYQQLKQQLCDDLAAYMVPSVFFALTAMPRTSSGKLDRKTLSTLAQTHDVDQLSTNRPVKSAAVVMLTDQAQQHLRTLWSQVLEVDERAIDSDSNFFRLGGDSISAMRLAAAVMNTEGLRLSVLNILRFPKLSRMATKIQREDMSESTEQQDISNSQKTDVDDKTSVCPESRFQATNIQAVMVRYNMAPERGFMNYFTLHLAPGMNKVVIETACRALLTHRSVLRSCFEVQMDLLVQRIRRDVNAVAIEHHTYTAAQDMDAAAGHVIESDRAAPLQWGNCLTKLFLLQQDGTGALRLIFRLSHALYDGMCLPALWKDLSTALNGQSLGSEDALFPRFATDAARVSHDAAAFWTAMLRKAQMTPVARGHRIQSKYVSATRLMRGRVSRAIASSHFAVDFAQFSITSASVFKAAWAVVLAAHSNTEDVVFGQVVSGRDTLPQSTCNAFGAFLNISPVRARLAPSTMSPAQLVQSVHDQHIAALPHSAVGLQQLVQSGCVDWPIDIRFSSIVQYQNLPNNSLLAVGSGPLAGAEIHAEGGAGACADLWVTATPNNALTEVEVLFDELVVPQEVADGLLEALCVVLGEFHAAESNEIATDIALAKASFVKVSLND